ncbi:MAG: hypothetical protein R3D27_13435 [Hyphomicrobiaceae bacterium]
MSEPTGRSQLAAALIFILAWAVLASPWLTGRVTIPYDAKAHFQAQIQFLANALHAGQSPAWSPNVFAGSPQIADPQSLIFSPAYLIAAISPAPSFQLFDGYVLTLLAIGGIAIIAFFRDRGWHPAGGLLAALVFAFGASASWRVQHIGQVQSYALFAVALLALTRALDRGSIVYGVGAGVAAGLMIVEPDQVALIGAYLLAMLVIVHVMACPGRRLVESRRIAAPLAAGAIAGALIVLVPLVMTVLFAAASSRPAIPFAEAARGSLHPVSLLTAIIADLFGALSQTVDYWGPYSETWDPNELTLSQNMSQVYAGILPVVLIIVVGFGRGWLFAREIRPYAMMLALVTFYALGSWTPVFRVMFDVLPGVAMFRRPADATFFIGALLGIVGGYLLHRWLGQPGPARLQPTSLAIFVLLLAAGCAIAYLEDHWREARLPIMIAGCWIACALGLLALLTRLPRPNGILAVALAAGFTTADLALNNGPNESTALAPAPYDILKPDTRNSTIRLIKSLTRQPPGSPRRDRVELAGLGFEWPNAAMVHGFDHVLGYNPLRLEVVTEAIGAGDTIAGPDQRQFTALFPSYRSRLADLLGLRYIATPIEIGKIDHRLKPGDVRLIARTRDAFVYENPRALPRVMLVRDFLPAEFGDLIATGAWPSFDPTRTVLLEEIPPEASRTRAVRAPTSRRGTGGPRSTAGLATAAAILMRHRIPAPDDAVRLLRYENTLVEIEAASRRPGYVVLNDVWHPWWSATVDGRPSEVLKANVMFRAVAVPAGRVRVRFTFEPLAGAARELAERVGAAKPPRRAVAGRTDWE